MIKKILVLGMMVGVVGSAVASSSTAVPLRQWEGCHLLQNIQSSMVFDKNIINAMKLRLATLEGGASEIYQWLLGYWTIGDDLSGYETPEHLVNLAKQVYSALVTP